MGQLMTRWIFRRNPEGDINAPDESNRRLEVARQNPVSEKYAEQKQTNESSRVEGAKKDDIVIAVMGPTGSGKSTFIYHATGQTTESAPNGLGACTMNINHVCLRDQKSRQNIVLVDTPGFNNRFMLDTDIWNNILNWLSESYGKDKQLSAILYLHPITERDRVGKPLKGDILQMLCGNNALDKVYFTATTSYEVEESAGKKMLEDVVSKYREKFGQGSNVEPFGYDEKSAKKLVQKLVQKILQKEKGKGKADTE